MLDLLWQMAVGFWATVAAMSPYLLFGFFVAGLLSVLISPQMVERHLGGRGLLPVLKASLFGVPLPLCSCGVIPVSMSLHKHGASKGATISFLLSTPQTGVDSILVTYSLLGPVFAIFRPLVAFATGLLGGALVNLFGREPAQNAVGADPRVRPNESGQPQGVAPTNPQSCHPGPRSGTAIMSSRTPLRDRNVVTPDSDPGPQSGSSTPCPHCHPPKPQNKFLKALKYGFVTLPRDIGKPLLLGLAVAAVISALVPEHFFAERLGRGLPAMLVMMALGIPIYVCASASVPVAAAMILKGLSPGAALVFLMTGPATNAAGLTTIWNTLGRRTALLYLLAVAGCALAAGLLLDSLIYTVSIKTLAPLHSMGPSLLQHLSAVALLALLAYAYFAPRPHPAPQPSPDLRPQPLNQ
jgi:uncharacterized membrane protein YraQ (UPF0718 family)